MRRTVLLTAVVLVLAAAIVTGALAATVGHTRRTRRATAHATFSDRFTGTRLDAAAWRWWWGQTAVSGHRLLLASRPPARSQETHSSLVTTKETWKDFALTVQLGAIRQLRAHAPNAWETAWVLFRFQNLHDYYYFILKPNGWELGKKQGSDAQIFLATGSSPSLAIGRRAQLRIHAAGARIKVYVDGKKAVDYVDPTPLAGGAVGLYEEDSLARFSGLRIAPLQLRRAAPPALG